MWSFARAEPDLTSLTPECFWQHELSTKAKIDIISGQMWQKGKDAALLFPMEHHHWFKSYQSLFFPTSPPEIPNLGCAVSSPTKRFPKPADVCWASQSSSRQCKFYCFHWWVEAHAEECLAYCAFLPFTDLNGRERSTYFHWESKFDKLFYFLVYGTLSKTNTRFCYIHYL